MKNIKYILLSLLMTLNFVACDNVDFGDLNKNINGATEPYTAGLMSGAIMSYGGLSRRNGLMRPTLYVQYQSQVTYTDEMLYNEVPISWYTYFVGSLSSLQLVIDYVSDEANQSPTLLSQGSPENQIGVAMILKAVIYKRVTDTYGDVPYTSALRGTETLTPEYDSQQSIYRSLIEDVKAARDMIDASTAAPTGDIIYGGDITKWKKFANSFLLQLSLQLSKADPTYASTEFNLALGNSNGVIETLDEEAWFSFEDNAGFRNPWNLSRTPDYFMSKEFTDALQGLGALSPTSNTTFDERMNVFATAIGDGVPYGYADGSGANAVSISNDYYWNNETPLPLFTASYTYLNRAEAAALLWTSEDAATMLQEGIEKSFETLQNLTTVAESLGTGSAITIDGSAYAAARVADAGTFGMAQVIGEEKWISLFGQAFDSWAEWRRTGYPNLQPGTDYYNDGNIPRRYLYPTEESTLNGSNRAVGISGLSPAEDKNTARVWWDQ